MSASRRQTLNRLHRQRTTSDCVRDTLREPGRPLGESLRAELEPRFGYDLSTVRVHVGPKAAASAAVLGARAYTYGPHIVFGAEEFAPEAKRGAALLAHEVAHTVQQSRGGDAPGHAHEADADCAARAFADGNASVAVETRSAPGVAMALDDWLYSSRNVSQMSYSELVSDIDEINEWTSRQMATTPESMRLEEALAELQQELARRNRSAQATKRKGRQAKKKLKTAEQPKTELPKPRVLNERTSVRYESRAEINEQVDLIMQWLARDDLTGDERTILELELDSLAPQFEEQRQKAQAERRAARLQRVFSPERDKNFNALLHVAQVVQDIVPDSTRPGVSLILHEGEQIAISAEQVAQLRNAVDRELERGRSKALTRAEDGFDRYRAQAEVNAEHPIISRIAGFLGDAGDPIGAMTMRNIQVQVALNLMAGEIAAKNYPGAARRLAEAERYANEIYAAGSAFSEKHIEGAGLAVAGLEITRDVSFAIAGSIAAIAAAPVVAAGVAGTGATGAVAFGATTVGTGAVVGTGTAVVRGGSAMAGELTAGHSFDTAMSAGYKEGKRGFKEGAVAGVTGGAAQSLTGVINVARPGLSTASQLGRRAAAEGGADFIGGATEAALEGKGFVDMLKSGGLNATVGVPGNLVGAAFKNQSLRSGAETLVGAGTAYGVTIGTGGTTEQAIQSAGTSVIARSVIGRASTGSAGRSRAEQRAFEAGQKVRSGAQAAKRQLANYSAAAMIGTADVVPTAARRVDPLSLKTVTEVPAVTAPPKPAALPKTSSEDATRSPSQEGLRPKAEDAPSVEARETTRGVTDEVREAAGATLKHIEENGLELSLHVGQKRLKDIQSGERDFVVSQRATFDIDEPLPVGQKDIKHSRAVMRALEPENRQLLDAPTNRRTKGLGIDPRDLSRKPREPVSVADDPSALLTRRFSEVEELKQVFEEAKEKVPYRGMKSATEIKNQINRKIRDIITEGNSPAAVAIRKALRDLGYARLPNIGWVEER